MTAYVEKQGACPVEQCLREGSLSAFLWGADGNAWSGICFDPNGAMQTALKARNADRQADRREQPRIFGGVVRYANRLEQDWYACSISNAKR
jgi:hypothetical protein